MPDISINSVARHIAEVAGQDVVPAFRNLRPDQIYKKQAGEIVTEIDIIAERNLAGRLMEHMPGSRVLGEEGFENDKSLIELCRSDDPVWIIDPIDGTRNFVDGSPCFAMMVSFRCRQQTRAAWVYDPVRDLMCTVVAGEGTALNGRTIPVRRHGPAKDRQFCSLGARLRKAHKRATEDGATGLPAMRRRLQCCGQEYLSLIRGEIQFLQYGVRLKPWDHAPGILMASEAGYYAAFLADETPYHASLGIAEGYLLVAPDRESWLGLRAALWDSEA